MLPNSRPPTHPGVMLREEYVVPGGLDISALAQRLDISVHTLDDLLEGTQDLTHELAYLLGEELGTTPYFWANLQYTWDLWHARERLIKSGSLPASARVEKPAHDPRKSEAIKIRLDGQTLGLLEQVGGNRSEYLRRLVEQHARDWQEAHLALVARGWSGDEMLACCDVLNGFLAGGFDLRQGIALSLRDSVEDGITECWGITPERWEDLAAQVEAEEPVARAVWALAREFWFGNEAVDRRLRRPG